VWISGEMKISCLKQKDYFISCTYYKKLEEI